jgi:hypothetical protein
LTLFDAHEERMKAQLLGSTPLTLLIKCICLKRQYLDREQWAIDSVTLCARCHRGILYTGLTIITTQEAARIMAENEIYEGELKALRAMDTLMRGFIQQYDVHPEWLWAPQTNRVARRLKEIFVEVDEARHRQGIDLAAETAATSEQEQPSAEYEDEYLSEEESEDDEDEEYEPEEAA